MSLSSPTVDAFRVWEAYFLKDADVVSAHLTRRAHPARFEGALVIMDQDDNGRPCLSAPLDWNQTGFTGPTPANQMLQGARAALDQLLQNPAAQADLQVRFPVNQTVELGIEEVRRWLAEAEPAPSTRSRHRPR